MGYIAPLTLPVVPPGSLGNIQGGLATTATKPPFIPVPFCAKVEVRQLMDGERVENVLWFYAGATPFTSASLATLALAVKTSWVNRIIPLQGINTELVEIRAGAYDTPTSPVVTLAVEPHVPGTSAFDPEVAGITIGIGTHTGFRGRSANGRVFLCGAVETSFDGGVPLDADRQAWLTAWFNLMSDLNALGYTYVLVSFRHQSVWRITAQVTTILILTVGQYVYTARRRLPGHNRHR
jgi:hypothetical protein